ncbi:TPA: hypothetical protein QDZ84_002604 [Shewanella algae]|uniref:hypothetical protein n=1 Tax=Shewanella algae TaxID=38313 RepID=UPI001C5653FA|nr:hypothetical protein [Shewanella algae]HDS1207580.1 hypothetical protein [Shewanella algae]
MVQILENIATSAIAISAVAYLAKSIVSNLLNKDLEKFKLDVKREAERKIEQYKSDLESERIRLNISYSEVFSRQANVIADLYKNLVKLEQYLKLLIIMKDTNVDTQQVAAAVHSWEAFSTYFDENRIFLPDDICELIDKLTSEIFFEYLNYRKSTKKTDTEKEIDLNKIKESEQVISQFPVIKSTIENKFKVMIGVSGIKTS